MPDLLLELLSEEIPARMQARAAEDLRKLVTDRLVNAGLVYEGARAFVTPRRLALAVQGVPTRQPDVREEKKGPRVGAPEGAIAGFLKSAGLKSINEAKVQPDKKGDFYVAVIERPGRAAIEVVGEILPDVIEKFPWPKSMRWGAPSARPGALTWVRPLHSIVATFGQETEDPDVVQFSAGGIAAGNETRGHRFMSPAPFKVRRLDDYVEKLEKAKVVADAERRRDIILAEAKQLAFAQGLELVEDEGLLAEVAGLVEWPVVLMGSFDQEFLQVPQEMIRATIRNNQKCFVLRDTAHAKLVDKFILVANIEADDGGKAIVAGNERVIRARLSDAKFFYETDLKTRLEDRLPKFKHIVFHENDRIYLLARANRPLPLAPLDLPAFKARASGLPELLLLHPDGASAVLPEHFSLRGGLFANHYHLRAGHQADVARVARFIAGRAVGLVLAGGGARGFAHIGIIKALKEAGVPFDQLGGTSMGAIIAAGLAREWSLEEMTDRMRAVFVDDNPLSDFTLPLIALLRGRKVSARLREHFDEVAIEELPLPFFAVSSDLTTGRIHIHRDGKLWRALRASVALPGILPPVTYHGHLLVDGGVMNNLPVDVMREETGGSGPIIACDVTGEIDLQAQDTRYGERPWWWLVGQRMRGNPSIVSILMRSGTVGSEAQRRIAREQCDFMIEPPMPDIGLRDWRKFDRAIQEGYDTARACIEKNGIPLTHVMSEGPGMPVPHAIVTA